MIGSDRRMPGDPRGHLQELLGRRSCGLLSLRMPEQAAVEKVHRAAHGFPIDEFLESDTAPREVDNDV